MLGLNPVPPDCQSDGLTHYSIAGFRTQSASVAACLITEIGRCDHVTPALHKPHWLPHTVPDKVYSVLMHQVHHSIYVQCDCDNDQNFSFAPEAPATLLSPPILTTFSNKNKDKHTQ